MFLSRYNSLEPYVCV